VFSVPVSALAQIDLHIIQTPQAGGSVSYGILPFGVPFTGSLIAPDGTKFGFGFGSTLAVSNLSFSAFPTRFFGTWTIHDGLPAADYHFTFSPFTLNDVVSDTPVIDTPATGSTVPPSFVVDWTYPSGRTPNTGVGLSNAPDSAVSFTFEPTANHRARFDVDLARLGNNPLTFNVGGNSSLLPFLSAVTPTSPRPYTVIGTFSTESLFTTVTVVPEPASIWLLSAGVLTQLVGRRRSRERRLV
jgi:hypothetical protein